MKTLLLGPHPANHSYSITRYFNFYRLGLPGLLGSPVAASCPGGVLPSNDELPSLNRRKIWWQNYIEWPLRLCQQKADLTHFTDHGLLWAAEFVRGGGGSRPFTI